jgi:RHS repeat-associated protein
VGNRTKRNDKSTDESTEYRWNIRDRLTGVTVRDLNGNIIKSAEYKYDVYNQRIAKTVDADRDGAAVATTERYVYGANQNIGLVFDENGNVNHRYLFGDGVDQIEADESNGNVLWALSDHLGSVRDVVDDSGTVLNHVVYDAFGGVTSQTDSSVVFRYGYTARELDAESGLQYNRARYLDSFTGRFISEDPISFQGGDSNLYRYVMNNSLNNIDPSGLEVQAIYILSLGILAVVDVRTGERASVRAFSGDLRMNGVANNPRFAGSKDAGPIPLGKYAILERNSGSEFFRLDPYDQVPYNDVDERSGIPYRDTYSLHPGTISVGCITIPNPSIHVDLSNNLPFNVNLKNNVYDWGKVLKIIRNTDTFNAPDNKPDTGILRHLRNHFTGEPRIIRQYGYLEVVK